MRAPSRRVLALLLGGQGIVALALPASAQAHGIVGKADLPIPVWLFSWTAAIVLVISFVALATMWTRPQLQKQHRRRLLAAPRTARGRAALEWLSGLIGVGLFALVLYSGFAGAQVAPQNFSVTFIYVIFWVGLPVASVLLGDVFRAFNPWRACARARHVAGDRRDRRLRLAGADLRRQRPPGDAGGALAGLLRADADRHGAVRDRAVEHAGRRLRRVL